MDTLHLLRDIHENVLVGRVPLLQPGLACNSNHLGNDCLQPYPRFGQVIELILYNLTLVFFLICDTLIVFVAWKQMGNSTCCDSYTICAILAVLWKKETWVSMAITPVQ